MQIDERDLSLDFAFPAPQQPEWAPKVERWYQLDGPAYGLCEFYSQLLQNAEKPGVIFLASFEGSLPTDRAFAETGALSPAKFVHTLPNVRASSLCQTMEWHGPVICIQNGENSFERAVEEARMFLRRVTMQASIGIPAAKRPESAYRTAWILGCQSAVGHRVIGKILSALHNEKESINFSPS